MKKRWFAMLGGLTLATGLVAAGCGPRTTTVDPSKTTTPEEYTEEMKQHEDELLGDVNPAEAAKPPAPATGEQAGGEKEKAAEEGEK